MEVLIIILKIAFVALWCVGVYYVVRFGIFFWGVSEGIYEYFEKAIYWVSYPIREIWKLIKGKLSFFGPSIRKGKITRFAEKHTVFGSARSIMFFLIFLLLLAILITTSSLSGKLEDFMGDIMTMMPIAFAFEVIFGDAEFTLAGLISTGFAAMLIGEFYMLCKGDNPTKGSFLNWVVSIVYYGVTTFIACYVGFVSSFIFNWMGDAGLSIFNTLKDIVFGSGSSFVDVLKVIGGAIALLFILYIGLLVILIALNEYIESFCYGAMGVVILIMVAILLLVLLSANFLSSPLGNGIILAVFFLCTFGWDFVRVNKKELLGLDDEVQ